MLVQLSRLTSSASVERKGKQLQKSHVQHLPETYLSIAAAKAFQRHQVAEGKRKVLEVIGKLIYVKCQDCDCPADRNKVSATVHLLSEPIPESKYDKVKHKIGAE